MKQSQLFTKTQKDALKDEVSTNAQLLIRAGFIDKEMAGVYTILPLGLRVMNKIENIIREEINAIAGQEIFMPTMQPKENWLKTGRWDTMDDLYKVKDASGREAALGPTHEEVVVPLMQRFINSYKDLPFAVYQFQNKFRMELRAKSGILRGREFIMKDLYSFSATQGELDEFYEKARQAYVNIFNRIGIGDKTYYTLASGGVFSRYSHEFQTVCEVGEDEIYIKEGALEAVNKEIMNDSGFDSGETLKGFTRISEKSVEVGNIFKLGTKYSEALGLKYHDNIGKEHHVIMGSYGIAPSRSMGTVVELHHDDQGIIWPASIAPFKYHILCDNNSDEAVKQSNDLYAKLVADGSESLLDDRPETLAVKIKDADLIGCPVRIIVSKKSLEAGGVEVKGRKDSNIKVIASENLFNLKF